MNLHSYSLVNKSMMEKRCCFLTIELSLTSRERIIGIESHRQANVTITQPSIMLKLARERVESGKG